MWFGAEAEGALLGAVLCDPARQQRALDHVEPGDMLRPWHGQVLAAMRRLRDRGQLPDAPAVYRELRADPDLPASVSRDAVPLASLMEAAPRPQHAGAYAAIVVEAAIRRNLALSASRLAQSAGPGDLAEALRQAATTRNDIAASAARWASVPQYGRPPGSESRAAKNPRPRSGSTPPGPARSQGMLPSLNGAVPGDPGPLAAGPFPRASAPPAEPGPAHAARAVPPAGEAAGQASARALRDLIDESSHLDEVARWLRPGHFAGSGHGRLYAVLLGMRAAGQPIDPVTVSWQAARHRLRTTPALLSGGTGAFAVATAREVNRLGTLAQITEAAGAMQADAADLSIAPGTVLHRAAARLEPILAQPAPGRAARDSERQHGRNPRGQAEATR
jgi:hypothetical protein